MGWRASRCSPRRTNARSLAVPRWVWTLRRGLRSDPSATVPLKPAGRPLLTPRPERSFHHRGGPVKSQYGQRERDRKTGRARAAAFHTMGAAAAAPEPTLGDGNYAQPQLHSCGGPKHPRKLWSQNPPGQLQSEQQRAEDCEELHVDRLRGMNECWEGPSRRSLAHDAAAACAAATWQRRAHEATSVLSDTAWPLTGVQEQLVFWCPSIAVGWQVGAHNKPSQCGAALCLRSRSLSDAAAGRTCAASAAATVQREHQQQRWRGDGSSAVPRSAAQCSNNNGSRSGGGSGSSLSVSRQ